MANYLSDRELVYEIIVSKGKGKLTKKAEKMLTLIAYNVIRKKDKSYRSYDDRMDCLQEGLCHLFINWKGFNELKYSAAMPYYVEIFKRGLACGLNAIQNRKSYTEDTVKIISLTNCNNGKGLSNI